MSFSPYFFFFFFIICALIGVAFLTLLERSILGYVQIRSGPNKVGYSGVLQPFSDAISLFMSENTYPVTSNFLPYYVCPVLGIFFSLVVWCLYPMGMGFIDFVLGILFFLCLIGFGVYAIMGSGWFSNSKFALLGCVRAIAQSISYEVSLAVVLISVMTLIGSYEFFLLSDYQESIWFLFFFFAAGFMWLTIMLAETNRTPFDFAEGESELVSGFNVEYSGGGFAIIFMAEYSSILFMSFLFSVFFMGGSIKFLSFFVFFISGLFIIIRGLLPRFRYDKLMWMAWSDMLPMSLVVLWVVIMVGWMTLM